MRGGPGAAVLAIALALGACSASSGDGGPEPQACGPQNVCVTALAQTLQKRLSGRVVGYVALVGDQRIAGGWARTAADPPALAMDPGVPANQASVGKLFTTIALLRTLAAQGKSVDEPIAPYLPAGWKRGAGVDRLTFRALLTHHSGVRYESNYIWETDDAARDAIADGVDPVPADALGSYNNINFAIVRDLLPRLLGRKAPNRAAADQIFRAWVQEEVLTPAGAGRFRCAVAKGDMLIYPSVSSLSAQDHGQVPELIPAACSPGGEVMTSTDVLAVLRALLAGRLLTAAQRTQMDDGCLGWDCSVEAQTGYRGKGGALTGGPAQLETYAAIVAGSVPVVVAINSAVPTGTASGPSVSGLGQVVAEAAQASVTP